jgi:hypothetical protein
MKQLQIDIKDGSTGCTMETLICTGMDAVTSHTILYSTKKKNIHVGDYLIPAKIDRWNLENGVITIYYKTKIRTFYHFGKTPTFFIEITRIYA